ncbi:MAG: IMPACT family protein [Candidatus Methylumidiphilus sp.]
MKTFTTLKDIATHQDTIKESVFIAYAARADSQDRAFEFLRAVMARHPDASHLCWAYRIGGQYRFSDGGEPGGTAGQPILRAIEGQDLDHVVVGVIRYFGGTKLGAGGLMRAYGGAAAEALRTAERQEESPRLRISAAVGFAHLSPLYHALDACAAEDRAEDYDAAGVKVTATLPAAELERFRALLRDGTRGQFELEAREDGG